MQKKQQRPQQKSTKLKAGSLRRSIKETNHQPDSSRNKERKNEINKIRNENGEITTDNTEIQRIIRDYYQQLYANKMDNVEEMDKFLEKYNFPKLNQEETENLNRSITSMEIETVIKSSSKQKPRSRRLHSGILPKIQRRANTYPTQTLPENCRGR